MNILLIQIRQPTNAMSQHERECIARRVVGLPLKWRTRNVFAQEPTARWLDGVSAMIIGGSGSYSVYDARSASWVHPLRDVIERALAVALPSFGICFGHQLLGYHLGSEVVTDPDLAEVGTVPIQLTDEGKKDPIFSALGPQFCAHTGHSDAVLGVPDGVELLGSSPLLDTQIFKAKGAPFYSTQFHPDISGAEAQSRYVAYQDALEQDIPNANASAVARFSPGQDESNTLLKSFLSCVARV